MKLQQYLNHAIKEYGRGLYLGHLDGLRIEDSSGTWYISSGDLASIMMKYSNTLESWHRGIGLYLSHFGWP